MPKKKTLNEILESFTTTHGNKYDYSLVDYHTIHTDVKIICKKHGIFEQEPVTHINGSICPTCNNESRRKTTEQFIIESNDVHDNIYDYSLVNYINARIKIIIICKKHGEFIQNPNQHLRGKGCPICKSSRGERKISKYMDKINILYNHQHKFDSDVVKRMRYDFYLPNYNTCIEYHGRQHYEPVDIFGGEDGFELTKKRDKIKRQYCIDNNITLIEIKYDEDIQERLNHFFE